MGKVLCRWRRRGGCQQLRRAGPREPRRETQFTRASADRR